MKKTTLVVIFLAAALLLYSQNQTGTIANFNSAINAVGAIFRNAQDKFRDHVNVKDFGAQCNGVTNDTAAFQAAYNFMFGKNGTIDLPTRATCRIDSVNVKQQTSLDGHSSTLQKIGVSSMAMLYLADAGYETPDVRVRHLIMIGDGGVSGGGAGESCIDFNDLQDNSGIEDVKLYQCGNAAIHVKLANIFHITGTWAFGAVNTNIDIEGGNDITLNHVAAETHAEINGPQTVLSSNTTGSSSPQTFQVASTAGFITGNRIVVGAGSDIETIVATVIDATHLSATLANNHTLGEPVMEILSVVTSAHNVYQHGTTANLRITDIHCELTVDMSCIDLVSAAGYFVDKISTYYLNALTLTNATIHLESSTSVGSVNDVIAWAQAGVVVLPYLIQNDFVNNFNVPGNTATGFAFLASHGDYQTRPSQFALPVGFGCAFDPYPLPLNVCGDNSTTFAVMQLMDMEVSGHGYWWYAGANDGAGSGGPCLSSGAGCIGLFDRTLNQYILRFNPTGFAQMRSYGAGVAHFDATGNITSSAVANSDLANDAVTVNGTTCTLGGTCTPSGAGGITTVTAGTGLSGGGSGPGTVTLTNSAPLNSISTGATCSGGNPHVTAVTASLTAGAITLTVTCGP